MEEKIIHRAIREVARRNGTTEEEVRREIEMAIDAALANADGEMAAKWKRISCAGEEPDAYGLIAYLCREAERYNA